MKKEETLEKLFKEVHIKPKGLDNRIMQEVYKQATSDNTTAEFKPKSWIWAYSFIGLLGVGSICMLFLIDLKIDYSFWVLGIAVIVSLLLEKIFDFQF